MADVVLLLGPTMPANSRQRFLGFSRLVNIALSIKWVNEFSPLGPIFNPFHFLFTLVFYGPALTLRYKHSYYNLLPLITAQKYIKLSNSLIHLLIYLYIHIYIMLIKMWEQHDQSFNPLNMIEGVLIF